MCPLSPCHGLASKRHAERRQHLRPVALPTRRLTDLHLIEDMSSAAKFQKLAGKFGPAKRWSPFGLIRSCPSWQWRSGSITTSRTSPDRTAEVDSLRLPGQREERHS